MRELLNQAIPHLTGEACDKFVAYYDLLIEWNERMNLTAITEPEEVVKKHFYDSLAALPYLENGAKVADVGTGAGFPAIPLLIMNPTLRITLVDSLQKRLTFLEEVLKTLNLSAEIVHARAEDFGRDPRYRAQFDATVSRAVATLPVLLELTVPLLKVGGKAYCYKGDVTEELPLAKSALHLLHASAEAVPVESDYGARMLVICTKNTPTPSTYPRKAGMPSKKPL
ncbi:MAG: 16S rRNA (guanine(527)-N(7))-methyltransferase RsmG [Clostridia bacterium]|nr:16S rRNA (guanine(527)-N(7))-methyltransferase RsmG [Clostridia bacterium]